MTDLLRFHVQVYALPETARPGPTQIVSGCRAWPLIVSQTDLARGLPVTFENASRALARLPRLFIEPDGSFVWVAPAGEPPWQVDGVLYDQGQRLAYAELKGSCPAAAFDALLSAFLWPQNLLAFALVPQGVVLNEDDFRRFAAAKA